MLDNAALTLSMSGFSNWQAVSLTRWFLVVSLLVQSFEMLGISNALDNPSPWAWCRLQNDWQNAPAWLQRLLNFLLGRHFTKVVYTQIGLIGGLCATLHWLPCLLLLFTVLLLALRFRGVFNGGSDYMTVVVLTGLTVSLVRPEEKLLAVGGLFYIAVHLTLSYFVAGAVKLRTRTWRNGRALRVFLEHSNYQIPSPVRRLGSSPVLMRTGSWFVILWECFFPLTWLWPLLAPPLLVVALSFHVFNFFAFGINRFVFAWLAAYPALLYCVFVAVPRL